MIAKGLLTDDLLQLFNPNQLMELACKNPLAHPRIEFVRDGKRINATDFGGELQFGSDWVQAALDLGVAILVRRYDLDDDATLAFVEAIADVVQSPVFATLFMTRNVEPSFPAHYDAANVLALQLRGAKRWGIFEQVTPLPENDLAVKPVHGFAEEQGRYIDLTPGDVLYVPRGMIHHVHAIDTPSVHISFGIRA